MPSTAHSANVSPTRTAAAGTAGAVPSIFAVHARCCRALSPTFVWGSLRPRPRASWRGSWRGRAGCRRTCWTVRPSPAAADVIIAHCSRVAERFGPKRCAGFGWIPQNACVHCHRVPRCFSQYAAPRLPGSERGAACRPAAAAAFADIVEHCMGVCLNVECVPQRAMRGGSERRDIKTESDSPAQTADRPARSLPKPPQADDGEPSGERAALPELGGGRVRARGRHCLDDAAHQPVGIDTPTPRQGARSAPAHGNRWQYGQPARHCARCQAAMVTPRASVPSLSHVPRRCRWRSVTPRSTPCSSCALSWAAHSRWRRVRLPSCAELASALSTSRARPSQRGCESVQELHGGIVTEIIRVLLAQAVEAVWALLVEEDGASCENSGNWCHSTAHTTYTRCAATYLWQPSAPRTRHPSARGPQAKSWTRG